MMIKRTQSGFSLIELLVATAIITLLASITLATTQVLRTRARDARRISDIRQIQNALELFYTDNFHYPDSANCGATQPNTSWCNSIQSLIDGHWIRDNGGANLSNTIRITPTDPRPAIAPNWTPVNGGTYYYYSTSDDDNQWYAMIFGLENYPRPLENQDGVSDCDGPPILDFGNANGVITVGVGC